MAKITQSLYGMNEKFYPHVTAASDRSEDWQLKPQIFNSFFTESRDPQTNCGLKIILRTNLKQIVPGSWEDRKVREYALKQKRDLTPNTRYGLRKNQSTIVVVKSWTTGEWDEFAVAVALQALEWNRRFWLVPPEDFTLFDFANGGSTFRPNIACEFKIEFVNGSDAPHINIEAANVYDPTKNYYRSHMSSYSSEVRHIGQMSSKDPLHGLSRPHTNYSTIAHEIGHAIGLPHIGILRSLPNCEYALVLDHFDLSSIEGPLTAALYKGGPNSNACYGSMSAFDDADNVMGMGSKFAVENAQPWVERLPYHIRTNIDMSKWKVLLNETPPRKLIGTR